MLSFDTKTVSEIAKYHPDAVGEMLRAWAFPGPEYGCYSTFDVRQDAMPAIVGPREFEFLWGRPFDGDDTDPNTWGYCDAMAINEIKWFLTPSGIEFGWHWDGDGSLAFFIPSVGVLENGDCKKSNEWDFHALDG